MMFGSCQYYLCIVFEKHDLMECISATMMTPFSLWFCLMDFFGSFLIPQMAIMAFHRAARMRPCLTAVGPSFERLDVDQEFLPCCCCCEVKHPAPRRLRA